MSSRKYKFVDLFQRAKLKNKSFPNPYNLYFPIDSTIPYIVVSKFDWILLESSVIGSLLGYSVIGFSVGSSVIGLSLGSSVIGSSLGYSIIRFSLGFSLESLVIVFSLRALSDSVLFRFFSRHFLVCRVPSVAATTWEVLQ